MFRSRGELFPVEVQCPGSRELLDCMNEVSSDSTGYFKAWSQSSFPAQLGRVHVLMARLQFVLISHHVFADLGLQTFPIAS